MKKRIIISLVAIIAVVLTIVVLCWVLTKEDKMTDDKINQLRIGMSEKEVVILLGEPDRKWGLEPTRNAVDVHYNYKLHNGDELELNFFPDLFDQDRNNQILSSVVVRLSDGNLITLLDGSNPVGTKTSVNLNERRYSFIEPTFFVASDNSGITVDQINQIERGMSLMSVVELLGEPVKTVDSIIFLYSLENSLILDLRFRNNILDVAILSNEQNESLISLLTGIDPLGTRIIYKNEAGNFSKAYPPISFDDATGETLAEKINQIESGMTKENLIEILEPLGLEKREQVIKIVFDTETKLSIVFAFDSRLYKAYIMQTSTESKNGYVLFHILGDRDPVGTRIQYDPETGSFSKIFPE